MALIELQIQPGIDKQNTTKGAENRWIDSDNIFKVDDFIKLYNMQKDIGNKQIKTMRSAGNLMSGLGRA